MAAPTKAELAQKRMDEIDLIRRSKYPEILRKGLKRLEEDITKKDTATSVVARIVEIAQKELKEMREEDLEAGLTHKPMEPVKEEEEDKPRISLIAIN